MPFFSPLNSSWCRKSCTISVLVLCFLIQVSSLSFAFESAVIFGKVVDQSTGEPLRKVRVSLRGSDLQAVTDDAGTYRIEGIPAGSYTLYVSTIGYRLLKKDIQLAEGQSQEVLFYLGQEAATISDVVHVMAPVFEEVEKTAASQLTLNSTEIKNLAGVLIDDPLRSVQTLPGVASSDDFYSFYSVRGGSFQSNGIVVDGVLTHSLAHTIQGTQEPTGSVTMMNGDLVESMVLFAGAFSAKYGDRTSSFLDIVTREGSRDHKHARAAVSGSNAAFVAEGPMDNTRRGSWIVSARKSYVDYLVSRLGPETDVNLGFGDVQGKIAYDLTDHQKFGASFVWGRTVLGRNPVNRGVTSLIDGQNNVGVGNLSWSYLPSRKVLWENRLYLIRETYLNKNKNGEVLGRAEYTELAFRSDLSVQASRQHRLEFGTLLRFIEDKMLDRRYDYGHSQFLDYDSVHSRYQHRAFYAQDRWALSGSRLAAILGVRVEKTELTGQCVVNPRASLEWRLGKTGKIDAGWGIFSQSPEVLPVLGRNGDPRLRAEVARHYVLGYEHNLGEKARLRFEAYERDDSDLQRSRNNLYRLVNGKTTAPDVNFHYDNALRGHSRGFEVFVQRRSANRLAGWISYGYEDSKRKDLVTGETYPSDFEQKHTINIYGSYRFSESWNLSVKARFGSNFPYPGYFEARGSDYYLSTERNRERLPYYGRVDLRANKAFYYSRSKLSLYLEILNVMNRENIRYDRTSGVNSITRRISFSKDTLLPIIPTAGFVLEF
jgi:hypothetical protein